MNSHTEDFYGAHKAIWGELGILKARLCNLKEIMEKTDIYLAGMM
jgi:hypothetical protein